MTTTFTVTDDHLRLARALVVRWQDGIGDEPGAPAVDPARPYGSANVLSDVARLVGDDYYEFDHEFGTDEALRYSELHHDMEQVLQIVLSTGRFLAGLYRRPTEFSTAWAWVDPIYLDEGHPTSDAFIIQEARRLARLIADGGEAPLMADLIGLLVTDHDAEVNPS